MVEKILDEIGKRYKLVVFFNKQLIEGNIKNPTKVIICLKKEAKDLRNIVLLGCGKKIDYNGDCMYISFHGKARFCSTCTRRLKVLDKILK